MERVSDVLRRVWGSMSLNPLRDAGSDYILVPKSSRLSETVVSEAESRATLDLQHDTQRLLGEVSIAPLPESDHE